MEKKKIYAIEIICLICFTFLLGYTIGLSKAEKNINNNSYESSMDVNVPKTVSDKALNKVVSENAEVVFQMQCDSNNGSKYIVERRKKASGEGIVGKKGNELEQKYKDEGYILKDINNETVQMIRKPLVYNPKAYVLMTENNEIVIAHANEKGSIFDEKGNIIERQGTGTKLQSLRPEDIKNIVKGDKSIQYKSNVELNDSIKDFDIKYEMPE